MVVDAGIASNVLSAGVRDSDPSPYKSRMRVCYVCDLHTRERMRRHVLKEHLPWYWYPATACWDCYEQETQSSSLAVRHTNEHSVGNATFDDQYLHLWCLFINGALHLLASWFGCSDLDGLLQYVLDRELHLPLRSGFSEQEFRYMSFYMENYSPRNVQRLTFKPPNHVVCIINWEIIACLLRRVSPERQTEFKVHQRFLTYEGSDVLDGLVAYRHQFFFVDAHFHLDLTCNRLRFRNFQQLNEAIARTDGPGFLYGVANFVFSGNWYKWQSYIGDNMSIFASFGIHPHEAIHGLTDKQRTDLEVLLKEERCVALGEIGLDFTTRCRHYPCEHPFQCIRRMREAQEAVFVELMMMAEARSLPIILHCRDGGDGSALRRVMDLIVQHRCCHLPIHLHCFIGDQEQLNRWLALIPRLVIGITWKTVTDCPNMVARIPTNKLVLESDAPYLNPFSCNPTNNPWNIVAVAEEVSRIRNTPMSVLNEVMNENAIRFYDISGRLNALCRSRQRLSASPRPS